MKGWNFESWAVPTQKKLLNYKFPSILAHTDSAPEKYLVAITLQSGKKLS